VLAVLAMSVALAGRNDPCDNIKPEQQLAAEQQRTVDTMLDVRAPGFGRGEAQVGVDGQTRFDTALLAEDDLAQGWYVYQLCVMKRDEIISASLHDELMRKLFGLQQPGAGLVTPGPAPVPGQQPAPGAGCPWRAIDSASASAAGVVINGQLWPVSTADERTALRDTMNSCGKGKAAAHLMSWTQKLDVAAQTNFLGQPTPDATRAKVTQRLDRSKMLKALEE